jgi:chemotaxis-related protein WspD
MNDIIPQSKLDKNPDNCWNVIGIGGDRTCAELSHVVHCRNCPVYSSAGRNLLERSIPENYQNEWTNLFSQTKATIFSNQENLALKSDNLLTTTTLTLAIFRLQKEWLALPAQVLKETISPTKIHIIPHRSNEILLGLVNIRGELQLCISLNNLLHLETNLAPATALSPIVYQRMVVIEKESHTWVFPVDEFYGLHQFADHELRDPPNHAASTIDSYTQGFFHWESRSLSYIDHELLFMSLIRKVLL